MTPDTPVSLPSREVVWERVRVLINEMVHVERTLTEITNQLTKLQAEYDGFSIDSSRRQNEVTQQQDATEIDMKAMRSWQDQFTGKLAVIVVVSNIAASLAVGFILWKIRGVP